MDRQWLIEPNEGARRRATHAEKVLKPLRKVVRDRSGTRIDFWLGIAGMSSGFTRRLLFQCALVALWAGLLSPAARAQPVEEEPPLSSPPIVVVNAASVDRLMGDLDYLFGSVDRRDMIDVINGLLDKVSQLKGVRRDQPLGVMLFLEPGLTPRPVPVLYIPSAEPPALLDTIVASIPNVVLREAGEGRFAFYRDLGDAEGEPVAFLHLQLADGYAFLSRDELTLDRELPRPAVDFAPLATRYDVCIDLRPENIPPGMRELFLSIVRTRTQAELQKRDRESDALHALRKAQGMNNLRVVEALLKETKSLTIGLDVSETNRQAVFEVLVNAVGNSQFIKTLQKLASEPSYFAGERRDDAAVIFSMNSMLDENSAKTLKEMLIDLEQQVARMLTHWDQGPSSDPAVDESGLTDIDPISAALANRFLAPFQALVENRNLDASAQFIRHESGEYILVAGLEIPEATEMETPLREIVDRWRLANPTIARAVRVEYAAATTGEITWHRLVPESKDERLSRIYGPDFAAYLGFEPNAARLALGGRHTTEVLGEIVTQSEPARDQKPSTAPFEFLIQGNQLIGLGGAKQDVELREQAFDDNNDNLRIDFRPTDTGGRMRIELGEGFIRMLGLRIAQRYDQSQL